MGEASLTTTVRAALAAALLAGFYLVAIGLIAGLGWVSVWLWLTVPGEVAQGVSFVVAAAAVGLAVPTWRLLRSRPEPPAQGLAVSAEQAAELWAQVVAIAETVGTRPPDEIRLIFDANAAVYEDARLMGLRPGRRYLFVGVPLLLAYDPAELRAVLAHELGHYAGHHTRLGALTYRGMRVIVHTIEAVGPASVAGAVLSGYAAVYALVSAAVLRRMELEADLAAARVAGRTATVRALRAAPRFHAAWEWFLGAYVRSNHSRGYTAEDLLSWFGWELAHRRPEAGWMAAAPGRWDSHPPIEARVAALRHAPEPEPADDAIVADAALMAAALRTDGFAEHLEVVAQENAERDADRLYDAAADLAGKRRYGLGSVLDLLAQGRDPGGDEDQVFAAVAAAVVAAGATRWRHAWETPMTLVRGDEPVPLRPAVLLACRDASGVAALRTLLLDLGVDEESVLEWAAPGRTSLDIGPVFRTRSGHHSGVELLLPDELFLLSYGPSGRRRPDIGVFEAGLAAAALAELRLRARLRFEETVVVTEPAPTGDRFLDSVLARVVSGRERPAYQWIQALGPDVTHAVARRMDLMDLYQRDAEGATHPVNQAPFDRDRIRRTRATIGRAMDTADLESRDFALGALLWATELAAPVLGRAALGPRFWLGQVAKRDPLAVAVRIVIGNNTPIRGLNPAP